MVCSYYINVKSNTFCHEVVNQLFAKYISNVIIIHFLLHLIILLKIRYVLLLICYNKKFKYLLHCN